MALHTFTLPAGTVCKRAGVPFVLMHATQIECHPDNWLFVRDGFVPSVASIDGQALVCSQSVQGLDIDWRLAHAAAISSNPHQSPANQAQAAINFEAKEVQHG